MPKYAYEAMNSSGQTVNGCHAAPDLAAAIAAIRAKGLFPTKVNEEKTDTAAGSVGSKWELNKDIDLRDRLAVLREVRRLMGAAEAIQSEVTRMMNDSAIIQRTTTRILQGAEDAKTLKEGTVYIVDGVAMTLRRFEGDSKRDSGGLYVQIGEVVQ
jgi:type II secretory pathway component PulF